MAATLAELRILTNLYFKLEQPLKAQQAANLRFHPLQLISVVGCTVCNVDISYHTHLPFWWLDWLVEALVLHVSSRRDDLRCVAQW